MALEPLATSADLTARGIDATDVTRTDALLRAASAIVREAAGAAISSETTTIVLSGCHGPWLRLPLGPVTGVSAVTRDGVALTDYRMVDGALWRQGGWWSTAPGAISVTVEHGYAEVPDDVIDLVCNLVSFGLALAEDGSRAGIAYDRIDDAQTGYAQGEFAVNAMEDALSERARRRLRERFGSGVHVTGAV